MANPHNNLVMRLRQDRNEVLGDNAAQMILPCRTASTSTTAATSTGTATHTATATIDSAPAENTAATAAIPIPTDDQSLDEQEQRWYHALCAYVNGDSTKT
ncbi:uncharacterized protein AB675_2999 [Cyphellophora attinorum]|uniref:Uncharacterized protein n=1 Tax=Cyphellophora attinorum TaxID=1664694 RepID=A0A0N1H4T2_9EURO|nr:uncharacterized protein AB675_2999 [Phialophora attinorum]KPI36476.1 hypothetical protein AB675_2999 [Phialophora attinorum]